MKKKRGDQIEIEHMVNDHDIQLEDFNTGSKMAGIQKVQDEEVAKKENKNSENAWNA